jgi:predicted dehydrogenase
MAEVDSAPWSAARRGTDARVLLRFEGGVSGVYTVSWATPGHEFFESGQQFYERLTGERGTLHVLQRWLVLCLTGRWPRIVRRGRRHELEEVALLRQLASAHAGQGESPSSGRDNLQTIAVMAACMESRRLGRWINPQDLLCDASA